MKPIGLTYKSDGELMIVHLCMHCGKTSSNRIAGDDNPYAITDLLSEAGKQNQEIIVTLNRQNCSLLHQEDTKNVLTILYGSNYHAEGKIP